MWYRISFLTSVILYTSLCIASPANSRRKLNEAMTILFEKPEEPHCPRCTQHTSIESGINEQELTQLRIEFIKQQILKKLKMKEPPNITKNTNLQIPISKLAYNPTQQHSEDASEYQEDDFYGKTDQVVLFPKNDNITCPTNERYPTACFTFQLPAELEKDDIKALDFWIYKKLDFFDSDKSMVQTFTLTEVETRQNFITFQTRQKEGWFKLDIARNVRNWLEFADYTYTIQISCETCGTTTPWSPVSSDDKKPFMVVNTQTNKKKFRPKRKVNCSPGVSECCRDKLYISFAEIGWSNWIYQPAGYDAYFCRGSCSNGASLTVTSSAHGAVIRNFLTQRSKRLELVPCCTPTHLSSIEVIYGDNQTVTKKTLPNMVVDSCGCM